MSGLLGIAAANLATVLLRRPRRIATIVPDCVLEEVALDELQITEHPVEVGAPISDHAYRRPSELIMKVGWSNSSSARLFGFAVPGLSRGLTTAVTSLGEKDYVTDVYEQLLALQRDREPFTVVTGKRTFRNMLVQSLAVTTDETTENTLLVVARMREVIIVTAAVRTVPPRDQQQDPARTDGAEDTGPARTAPEDLPPPIAEIQREELAPL
jgi:hypothetical protein